MNLNNGEQKIFVWIDFTPETEVTILHGIEVAKILDKELCLMCQIENEGILEEVTTRMNGLGNSIHPILGMDRVHHYISRQPLSTILTELAEEFDALLLVAHKQNSKELLPQLAHSGFPFLFVSSRQVLAINYQKIAVPIGYLKKGKDLALWSSYFARHNGAKVSLILANDYFEEDKRRVLSILLSIERLFKNFHFPYESIFTHTPTWKIQRRALEEAVGYQEGLLIITFTNRTSVVKRLFRIDDRYVIDRAGSLSVMCINSQRDLYTFCS